MQQFQTFCSQQWEQRTSGGEKLFDPLRYNIDFEGLIEDGIDVLADLFVKLDILATVDIQHDNGDSPFAFPEGLEPLDHADGGKGVNNHEVGRVVRNKRLKHAQVGRRADVVPILKQHGEAEAEVEIRTVNQDALLLLFLTRFRGILISRLLCCCYGHDRIESTQMQIGFDIILVQHHSTPLTGFHRQHRCR